MDIVLVLSTKFPGTEWSLSGNDYDELVWYSDSPKPTLAELEALWPEAQYEYAYAQTEQARAQAYRETSDPIFFQYQRGTATEAEWLAAVQAVKDQHPYPEAV
jgi:hypothetical protein